MEQEQATPQPLQYVSFRERRAPMVLYVLALICGAAPLTTGLTCLIGFWITSHYYFVQLGVATLFIGGGMVFVGFVIGFASQSFARHATIDQHRSSKRAKLALLLLTLNIPAAIVCSVLGIYLQNAAEAAQGNW